MGIWIKWNYLEYYRKGKNGKYKRKLSHRMIEEKGLTYLVGVQKEDKENGKEKNIWRASERHFPRSDEIQ